MNSQHLRVSRLLRLSLSDYKISDETSACALVDKLAAGAFILRVRAAGMITLFRGLFSRPKRPREGEKMAEKVEDLDIPMRPARAATPTSIPARLSELNRPNMEAPKPSDTASEIPPRTDPAEPRTMIVGRGISLSGDIRSCNRLVVDGSLEATLHECRQMDIAETGYFKGNASVEEAVIRGQFEGDLTVSKRLFIRASGHVAGTITYGEIEIERGGKVAGQIQEAGLAPYVGLVRAGE
jgi:cytoskeletal protein CcmA (bactofilin family)